MSWSVRYTTQKSKGFRTITGSPETSREGERGSSDTLCTLDVYPCTTLPQPARYRTVSPGRDIAVRRVERWEVAAVLRREGGLCESMGMRGGVRLCN